MSGFDCKLCVRVHPPACKKGGRITVSVIVEETNREISCVIAEIPKYRISKKLPLTNANEYALSIKLPIFVPKGKYAANVFAVDIQGNRSKYEKIVYEII